MHGPVRNAVSPTTQGRFWMPEHLQSSSRRLAKKKEKEKIGMSGEEGKFWQGELGSKTKDYTLHTLQICAIKFPEKRKFFVLIL